MEEEKLIVGGIGDLSNGLENVNWSTQSETGKIQLLNNQAIRTDDYGFIYGGSVTGLRHNIPERTTEEILNEISSLKYSLKIIADRILEIERTELSRGNVNEEKIERRKLIT